MSGRHADAEYTSQEVNEVQRYIRKHASRPLIDRKATELAGAIADGDVWGNYAQVFAALFHEEAQMITEQAAVLSRSKDLKERNGSDDLIVGLAGYDATSLTLDESDGSHLRESHVVLIPRLWQAAEEGLYALPGFETVDSWERSLSVLTVRGLADFLYWGSADGERLSQVSQVMASATHDLPGFDPVRAGLKHLYYGATTLSSMAQAEQTDMMKDGQDSGLIPDIMTNAEITLAHLYLQERQAILAGTELPIIQ